MYPHERSLVKKLEHKPFALLGINSDTKERLRRAMEKENIAWRSWWDEGSVRGPIARAWGVRGWPTLYVLDHTGMIRYKDVSEEAMENAIEKLLNELPKTTNSP